MSTSFKKNALAHDQRTSPISPFSRQIAKNRATSRHALAAMPVRKTPGALTIAKRDKNPILTGSAIA